jgi:hypothetical protein
MHHGPIDVNTSGRPLPTIEASPSESNLPETPTSGGMYGSSSPSIPQYSISIPSRAKPTLPAIVSEASLNSNMLGGSTYVLPYFQSTNAIANTTNTTNTTNNHNNAKKTTGYKPSADNDSASSTDSMSSFSAESIGNLNSHLQLVSLLEKVDNWNWDVFDLDMLSSNRPLFTLGHYLFLKSDLYNKFQIQMDVFLNFLTGIENGYHRDVPYHNSVHATDVLHGVYFLKNACASIVVPTDIELLALYVAAIVHDFE